MIREMKRVFDMVPKPERVEFILLLLPKLVCSPTKLVQRSTSPLAVLLGDGGLVDPNAISAADGRTALLYLPECSAGDASSAENQVTLARQLIEAGADVNRRAGTGDGSRTYPLHTACHCKNITNLEYIRLLLDNGAVRRR